MIKYIILIFLALPLLSMEPNKPELSLPLINKKIITAHFMPGDVDYEFSKQKSGGLSRSIDNFNPDGRYKRFGGLSQVAPMDMFLFKRGERTLDEVAEFELRAAEKAGIDVFQFYYPNHTHAGFMDSYNKIIASFFKVADEKYPNFKFTLCLSNSFEGNEAEKIARWTRSIGKLLEETSCFNNWFKTPDGRIIFYLWNNDGLAEIMNDQPWQINQYPKRIKEVAIAHKKLADALSIRAAYIYDLRFPQNQSLVEEITKYFPAIWTWTSSLDYMAEYKRIGELCKERQREFSFSIYPDYYTSKIYWQDRRKGNGMLRNRELYTASPENAERHYQNCGLSYLYRKLFDFALEGDYKLLNIITWNDYPEGHHFAPEINHNFAPMVLLEYYRKTWLGQDNIEESASVFYKKYRHDIKPLHDFPIYTKRSIGAAEMEDDIEVVTILNLPAEVYINNKHAGDVRAGIQAVRIPSEPGAVKVEVKRNGELLFELNPPEQITNKPFRTDRLTYMYSSRFKEYFEHIFGASKEAPESRSYTWNQADASPIKFNELIEKPTEKLHTEKFENF